MLELDIKSLSLNILEACIPRLKFSGISQISAPSREAFSFSIEVSVFFYYLLSIYLSQLNQRSSLGVLAKFFATDTPDSKDFLYSERTAAV